MLRGCVIATAAVGLLLSAPGLSAAAAETGTMPPSECTTTTTATSSVTLCPGNARSGEAPASLTEHYVEPGAIEPPPVNLALEEEFWAHINERRARGKAATQSSAEVTLLPPTEGGWVGWCVKIRGSAHDGTRCPIAPKSNGIAYEQWEAAPGGTQGLALASGVAEAVAVDEEGVAPLVPVPGFAGVLGAAVVEISDPFPWIWSDEFEAVSHGLRNSGERGFSAPAFTPTASLPATYWVAPQAPPPGACQIVVVKLAGAKVRWGHVATSVTATPGIAAGGFASCVDTELSYGHSSLDAAVLLDAAAPGATPPPLPNANAVHGQHGLYSAPGFAGEILARRIAGAWLLVEGGRGLRQRETVLAHLRASVGV